MRPVSAVAMAALALGPLPAASQQSPDRDPGSGPRAEILVLGTYHMANPGRDVFNMDADDVLSPRRQAEIVELVDVLRRFRPTRIAMEAGFSDRALGEARGPCSRGGAQQRRARVAQGRPLHVRAPGRAGRHSTAPTGRSACPGPAPFAGCHSTARGTRRPRRTGARRVERVPWNLIRLTPA